MFIKISHQCVLTHLTGQSLCWVRLKFCHCRHKDFWLLVPCHLNSTAYSSTSGPSSKCKFLGKEGILIHSQSQVSLLSLNTLTSFLNFMGKESLKKKKKSNKDGSICFTLRTVLTPNTTTSPTFRTLIGSPTIQLISDTIYLSSDPTD